MHEDTLIRLKSLGVETPICQSCRSEDFDAYTVLNGKVICCSTCGFDTDRVTAAIKDCGTADLADILKTRGLKTS